MTAGLQAEMHPDPRSGAQPLETYITTKQLKAMLGGVSDMCLWRWERDERVALPKRVKIGVRRVGWLRSEIEAWLIARVGKSAAA